MTEQDYYYARKEEKYEEAFKQLKQFIKWITKLFTIK